MTMTGDRRPGANVSFARTRADQNERAYAVSQAAVKDGTEAVTET